MLLPFRKSMLFHADSLHLKAGDFEKRGFTIALRMLFRQMMCKGQGKGSSLTGTAPGHFLLRNRRNWIRSHRKTGRLEKRQRW